MMIAFIVGLLLSNSIVVAVTATGFIASRLRERVYVVIGVVAGTFSLVGVAAAVDRGVALRGRLVSAIREPARRRTSAADSERARWAAVPAQLRARGLRWTNQRRVLIEVLAGVDGHVTGAALVDGCRAIDPATTPSTVYRALDVLEELGIVSHSHGPGGRQEFHVNGAADHGHLLCSGCGRTWELGAGEVSFLVDEMRRTRGFAVDVDHLTVEGTCAACLAATG
jgi:Fur family ferric uptake transcriptional regulator